VPAVAQPDTPVKKLLVGIAVGYMSLIVILPFVFVFFEVRVPRLSAAAAGTCCSSCCSTAAGGAPRCAAAAPASCPKPPPPCAPQAFKNGFGPFVEVLSEPDFQQSVKMTLLLSAVAVPINTVFGVCAALFLSRNEFRFKPFLITFLDLPFSISPVVTGAHSKGGAGSQSRDARPRLPALTEPV
jgi:ABC-type sulfate transport system permease subunit